MMKRYGVNHYFSTSYHPQTSGQVENTNGALKRILEKTVKDNHAIWSRKLDDALWAFRTAYKTPTSTTPYKLIYGKNFHLPFQIEHRAYWALKNCNLDLIAAGLFLHDILDRLCRLAILCLDQHAHTLHHLKILLIISPEARGFAATLAVLDTGASQSQQHERVESDRS
ncbi:reverse transcriptase domain-containing protein [Tanacetum coccineum]